MCHIEQECQGKLIQGKIHKKCGVKAKHKNIEGVALENKIGHQKSTCVVWGSKKSVFLKPMKPKKEKKQ